MAKARLLTEAEQIALISCEQGARISREASGIHYYLRWAQTDPANTVPMNPCVGGPMPVVGIASPEAKIAVACGAAYVAAQDVAEDVDETHGYGMLAVVAGIPPEKGEKTETAATPGTVKVY